MKIGSIDIGTNAIKSKIFETSPSSISFIGGIRSPIRLGEEVFKNGYLSDAKLKELVKTIKKYQKTFRNEGIELYEIVATSAFRNSNNSEDARRYLENKINHPVRIISGLEEAKLISYHPKAQSNINKIYVDVGGGSTECYIFENGKHSIQSFQLGAVRLMLKKDKKSEWKRMNKWLAEQENIDTLIGLGGNIKAFLNINKSKKMSSKDFIKNAKNLKGLNIDEKIKKYNFSEDRADVIDYAMIIFERIINQLKIKEIRSTKWGVSDSIAVKTFNELYSKKISIYKD